MTDLTQLGIRTPNQLLSNVPSPPTTECRGHPMSAIILMLSLGGVNGATDESMFYGPYNTLLGCLFPATDYYVVTPQFTPTFLVQKASRPVFFLDIKPPAHYTHRSSRAAADAQMRTQFYALADVVELPVIHGVSALGTHVCFYSYNRDNAVVDPPPIPTDVNQMNDVAPAARWNFDVLSDEGVARMTQVANEVKAMVAQHAW